MSATMQVNVVTNAADATDEVTTSFNSLFTSTARLAGLGVSVAAAYDMMQAYGERYAMLQERTQIAQENVTKALMNYGAGSLQVMQAQQQLVAIQHEARYAQGEYNREVLMMSAMIIPQLIGMIPTLTRMFDDLAITERIAAIAGVEVSASLLGILTAGVGAIALIAVLASAGSFGGGGTSNVNVYGDVNMQGFANPYQFGTSVQSWTQSMRG